MCLNGGSTGCIIYICRVGHTPQSDAKQCVAVEGCFPKNVSIGNASIYFWLAVTLYGLSYQSWFELPIILINSLG